LDLGEIGPCAVSPWRQHGGAVLEFRRIGRGAVVEATAWGQQSSSAPTDRRGGTMAHGAHGMEAWRRRTNGVAHRPWRRMAWRQSGGSRANGAWTVTLYLRTFLFF
jgi:hypothetical protein